MATLNEVCTIIMGQSPSSSTYNAEGIGLPFFQGNADFGDEYPTIRLFCSSPIKIAEKGDVLVSVRAPIGAVNKSNQRCCIGRGLSAIRPIKDKSDDRYLYHLLISNRNYLESRGTGSTFKAITGKVLSSVIVPVHNLSEQKVIASILDKIVVTIQKRKKQIKLYDDLVKSQFIEIFGDPEINQHGFDKVTVNDVCTAIVRGPFGSALKKDFFVEKSSKTYKVYEQKHAIQKSAAIGTYYIDETKFKELKRFECKPGDFLMSCSGTMGELYQLPADCERGIINQALCKFTLNDKIVPVFFLTYMSQTIGNLETKGSGIKNIAAVSYVKAMPVILPPIELQNEFAHFVEQTDKSKFRIKQSLEKLEILYKALLQKYFG